MSKVCIICTDNFKPQYKTTERVCSNYECRRIYNKMLIDASKEKQRLKTPDLKLKKVYVIPKKSKKRIIEDAKYMVLRTEFFGRNKYCAVTGEIATEIHHTYSGKDRSKHYLDTDTWLAVSRNGHNWIHDNPKEAREKGFLK